MTGPILVTGGAGALGRVLVARLRGGGDEVVSASRAGADRVLDVTDAASVVGFVADLRPRAVVHLASALPGATEEAFTRVNVDGTAAVAFACASVGARLVFASSAAVYGVRNVVASSEGDVLAPGGAYGASKARAEERVAALGDTVEALTLRIFNVVGAGFPGSLPSRLLHSTAVDPVELRGPDAFVRDYVHVDDVAAALAQAVEVPLSPGHTVVNTGTGVPTSTTELRELLARRHPLHAREVPGPDDRVWAETSRAARLFGSVPGPIRADWFRGA